MPERNAVQEFISNSAMLLKSFPKRSKFVCVSPSSLSHVQCAYYRYKNAVAYSVASLNVLSLKLKECSSHTVSLATCQTTAPHHFSPLLFRYPLPQCALVLSLPCHPTSLPCRPTSLPCHPTSRLLLLLLLPPPMNLSYP